MTRFQFYAIPLIVAGVWFAAIVCCVFDFGPFAWLLNEAHQFAREIGGR